MLWNIIIMIAGVICMDIRLSNIFNINGKIIGKLNDEKNVSKLDIFGVFAMILSIILVGIGFYIRIVELIISSVLVISGLIGYYICSKNYSKVTEKGIYTDDGFYEWKIFRKYEWIHENTVKFSGKSLKIISIEREMIVDADKRDKAETLFEKYIKK